MLCNITISAHALSLYDLEKRPSLIITGIKILHNGTKIIVGIGDITKIEHVDGIVNAAHDRLIFDNAMAGSLALDLCKDDVEQTDNEAHAVIAKTLVDTLKTDTRLNALKEVVLVIPHQPNAQCIAQQWLAYVNEAIHNDPSYQTLVGSGRTHQNI